MKHRFSLIIGQKIFSILFLLAALLLGVLMFWYIGQLQSGAPGNGKVQQVIIANTDILSGISIERDMVKVQDIPDAVFSGRAVKEVNELLGKEARRDIDKGEIIYVEHISGYEESFSGISSYIPRGKRAVTIPVTFYGEEALLQVGESVDLISIYYDRDIGDMVSLAIIEDKEIIHIGGNSGHQPESGFFAEEGLRTQSGGPDMLTVSFYLSPSETESVFLAAQRGIINIAICPYVKFHY